ncbi:hypothetical protein [Shouchella miscanthi]|uniref:Uncharacterized protein n=1 Tax=Shouchella miscanthi TaxID=2598861 RepID=A0ABU6NKX5_9BACI|nr:hypothetical protein [Shouchella miscanthi]
MLKLQNTDIPKSKKIQKRSFSTREDYESYFKKENLWNNEQDVKKIHQHWHGRGQTGCIFAQHLAKKTQDESGWYSEVITKNDICQEKIDNSILEAIDDPNIEVLSFLFPNVVTVDQLSFIVKSWIKDSTIIFLEKATYYDEHICLSLRLELGDSGIYSWLMMFAPFTSFPNTRQSPITELAIRVKPKPEYIYPKLSQDRDKAHLADTPFVLSDSKTDRTWEATFKNTEYLLGYKPNLIAAAKTTISFDINTWQEKFNELNIKISEDEKDEEQYK